MSLQEFADKLKEDFKESDEEADEESEILEFLEMLRSEIAQ